MTSTSQSYLSELKVPLGLDYATFSNSDYELDGEDTDDIEELGLADCYNDSGNVRLKEWIVGLKCDPLKCARKVITLLRSLNRHREGFHDFILDGNRHKWFTRKDENGVCSVAEVPALQLLRHVKMRWDSVYLMLSDR